MKQELILLPALALVLLTLLVLGFLGCMRILAIKNKQVDPRYFRLIRGYDIPDRLLAIARNYQNLSELPIIFYMLTLSLYLLGLADYGYLVLCSLFVMLRYLHSYVHLFGNPVRMRFAVFVLGYLVLSVIFVRLLIQILSGFV